MGKDNLQKDNSGCNNNNSLVSTSPQEQNDTRQNRDTPDIDVSVAWTRPYLVPGPETISNLQTTKVQARNLIGDSSKPVSQTAGP